MSGENFTSLFFDQLLLQAQVFSLRLLAVKSEFLAVLDYLVLLLFQYLVELLELRDLNFQLLVVYLEFLDLQALLLVLQLDFLELALTLSNPLLQKLKLLLIPVIQKTSPVTEPAFQLLVLIL